MNPRTLTVQMKKTSFAVISKKTDALIKLVDFGLILALYAPYL